MAGYTGTITDSLGRKIKFVNGQRVKGESSGTSEAGISPENAAKRNEPVIAGKTLTPHQQAKLNEETGQIPTGKLEPSAPVAPPPDPAVVPTNGKLKFDPRFHFTKDQREFLGKTLGGDVTWKLVKVTEKHVETLDNIAQKIVDPQQWRAVNSITNKVDNAAKVNGYAYMPVGTFKQQQGKLAVVSAKRGVENKVPLESNPFPLRTHSIISQRSPKVKQTDRPLTKGETAYSNIIHNQTGTPTDDEWKALKADLHKLDRDKINRLYKKFAIPRTPEAKSVKQLRRGIEDHIADVLEQGAGEEKVKSELGSDKRAGKISKKDYTHFRPKKKK